MKINVALISGGYSKEDVVSFNSAKEIAKSIDKSRFKVYQVLINREKWVYIDNQNVEFEVDKNDFSVIVHENRLKFDVAFITIHGAPGEDGRLQGYFDMIGMPYTTCDAFTSALTFNKVATKRYLQMLGVHTAPYIFLKKDDRYDVEQIVEDLGLPLFVKPNAGGSSFGITKVKAISELKNAINAAFDEDGEILIESFIDGTEVTCGLIKTRDKALLLPATEIVSKNEFFDYDAKYNGEADEITPARITKTEMNAVQQLSSQIYDWLSCHGIVRIDYLMKDDRLYLIEVNTVPGMSAASIVPQQAEAYGMTTTELFSMAMDDAIQRAQGK